MGFVDHVCDRLETVDEEMAEDGVGDWSACAEGFGFQVGRWVGVGDGVFDEVVAAVVFQSMGTRGFLPPFLFMTKNAPKPDISCMRIPSRSSAFLRTCMPRFGAIGPFVWTLGNIRCFRMWKDER